MSNFLVVATEQRGKGKVSMIREAQNSDMECQRLNDMGEKENCEEFDSRTEGRH